MRNYKLHNRKCPKCLFNNIVSHCRICKLVDREKLIPEATGYREVRDKIRDSAEGYNLKEHAIPVMISNYDRGIRAI